MQFSKHIRNPPHRFYFRLIVRFSTIEYRTKPQDVGFYENFERRLEILRRNLIKFNKIVKKFDITLKKFDIILEKIGIILKKLIKF